MKRVLFFLLVAAMAITGAYAQTSAAHDITIVVPQIQLIRLFDASAITLTVGTAGTPGAAPVGDTNALKYLQYTVLNPSGVTQKITVEITAGTLPAGTALAVAASGGLGTPGSTAITGVAADLITAIPSGNTGIGATDGTNLTYTLTVPTPGALVENGAGATVTVTYTILDT
ncbi:MAG: hypothetical protein E4H20_07000 [Spirochaetales bacterium]|nr:MAG: hypothetical protein E4H20_07000 [Spirochaetales bacterium]